VIVVSGTSVILNLCVTGQDGVTNKTYTVTLSRETGFHA